jgi:DNA-binding MarR family transcriptional regulator
MSVQISRISDKKSAVSGFALERTARRMKQACQQYLKEAGHDLTVDQWVLLQELSRSGAMSQLDLGQRCFKDAPTMTRMIDLLCKKGLLERRPDAGDRRRFQVWMTPQGEATFQAVEPSVKAFRQQAYRHLSEQELDQLMQLLDKIYTNIS